MKRLILRWVALAVTLVALALVCVRLGEWQLSRLDQRREFNAAVAANRDLPPVDYRDLMGAPVSDHQQWRVVQASGRYAGQQYQVRYRNVAGAPGIEVVAVFITDAGDVVLVDRGFIPRKTGQPDTQILPDLPAGPVEVTGYLRRDERGADTAVNPHDFKVRLINAEAIGDSLNREILPGYISLISSQPPNDSALEAIEPPAQTEGNHFSYALQWFAFGAIALIGIVVLIRADLADRRKALAKAGGGRAEL